MRLIVRGTTMLPKSATVCLTLLTIVVGLSSLKADDWPQFLGLGRNGVSAERNLRETFDGDGPEILWKSPLGVGMSGIAVRGQRLLTLYQTDSVQFLVCLDVTSGDRLWQTEVDPAFENAMGNGPRATPTIADQAAYAFTGSGNLVAVNLEDGRLLWKTEMKAAVGGQPAEYGNASSPLVTGESVIVQFDGRSCSVVSCDRATGAIQWQSGTGTAGYSSPALLTLDGKVQVVAFTGSDVLGIDPSTGTALWTHPFKTEYDCNTVTPIALSETQLLISAGENHGSEILEVTNTADAVAVRSVWTSFGKGSVLRAEWQTPVLIDGHLYGLDNVGSAGPITNLVCVRLSDGKQLWMERRFGKSNFTYADGRLYFSTMKGELVIGNIAPSGFRETARHQLLGMTRQAPVIADGRLYLRDDEQVICVNLSNGS
jgi:outer membrane protein assembly factor BamB